MTVVPQASLSMLRQRTATFASSFSGSHRHLTVAARDARSTSRRAESAATPTSVSAGRSASTESCAGRTSLQGALRSSLRMRQASTAAGEGSAAHEYTNGLINTTSPYLLQHAHNPVDWVPWSQAALDDAKQQGKMIFLSSGYASCHWCHVMAHESFEDKDVAKVMNDNLVCIKLDREERPDVDAAFMTFIQATSGRGGWPMSVFLTSDGEPLFGGTYFPAHTFVELIEKLVGLWNTDRERCLSSARDIAAQLRDVASQGMEGDRAKELPSVSLVAKATRQWLLTHDEKNGGFGNAPKFPSPPNTFHLLHRIASETANSQAAGSGDRKAALPGALGEAGLSGEIGDHALRASTFTLARIARGGITDHLGGGIARYSVDDEWRVPHFEKMLYDEGQLLTAFAEAIQLSRDDVDAKQYVPEYEGAIAGIVQYLARDMTNPDGALFAAEDADSLETSSSKHAKEGAFYVWTDAEVRETLGGGHADTYKLIKAHFGLNENGNIPAQSDPHGDLKGKNMLHASRSLASTASALGIDAQKAHELWQEAKDRLLKRRDQRPRPGLDDKVITSWNGLAISGLAKAAQVLGPSDSIGKQALSMAERASDFVWNIMWDAKEGQILRSWRKGTRGPWGFDVDYAFMVQALLDLYEATWDGTCIDRALTLQAAQDALFWDHDGPGGYLMSPAQSDGNVLGRQRGDQEGAEPTSTSVAAHNLLRLQALVSDVDAALRAAAAPGTVWPEKGLPSVKERIVKCITSGGMVLSRAPHALGTRLTALLDARLGLTSGAGGDKQLVIVGKHDDAKTQALVNVTRAHLLPRVHTVMLDSESESQGADGRAYTPQLGHALREYNDAVKGILSGSGAPAKASDGPYATVCSNFACGLPIREPDALLQALRQ